MTVEIAVTNLNTKRAAIAGGRKSRHCPATVDTLVPIIGSIPVARMAILQFRTSISSHVIPVMFPQYFKKTRPHI